MIRDRGQEGVPDLLRRRATRQQAAQQCLGLIAALVIDELREAARPPAAEPYSRATSAGSGWGRGGRRTSVRLTVARPWMTGSVLSGPSNADAIVRQSASVAREWFHPYSARVAP
jgi:hypothetical protein